MDDRAPSIEHDAIFGHPERPFGEKVAEQPFVILSDRLRQHAFDMVAHRDRKSQALRVESARRARDIHDAKQLPIGWIVNGNGGAGPSLHLGAEMLCTMNLNRF
jgi:hypothetical protein